MKNTLLISAVFPPEPVVSAMLSHDIANALLERNKVTVISPKPSRPFGFDFSQESLQFKFKHVYLDSFICASSSILGRFKESYSFGRHAYKYIVKNQNDINIIYANTWPLIGQYFAIRAAMKFNIPIIIHVQDIYPESLTSKIPFLGNIINIFLLPIDKYVLRKSTKIIAISKKMKKYLSHSRKVQSSKISVVENWQDENLFLKYNSTQANNVTNKSPFTFMYLGNIGPVAGITLLIDSFAKAKLENSRLIIAGSGSMKENLIKYAKDYDKCCIEFWSVADGKVPEIQSKANILILPIKKGSASNSIPSKLPAYMFSKKPVIASVDYDSDTAEAVRNSGCGWVITPESVNELSNLMQKVVSEEQNELKVKGNNGFNYAKKHYSKVTNLSILKSIIEETT